MDFFEKYGMTQQDILDVMSAAIVFIDRSGIEDKNGTADLLMDAIAVLKDLWGIDD